MTKPVPVCFNWSGGKDSALALYTLMQDKAFDVQLLMTSLNADFKRISMHGIHETLLLKQVASIGLPLHQLLLPSNIDMAGYDKLMGETMATIKAQGILHSGFGDIFLEDLKNYREARLAEVGMSGIFPLWQQSSEAVIQRFFDLGFKAKVVSVNAKHLDQSFCGRDLDADFIADLPKGVDVCGENGEFHSFVYGGPIFKEAFDVKVNEVVEKVYPANEQSAWDHTYYYADLSLA